MTVTYDCIATTTLGSAQSSVTFSSISGNYTDLIAVLNLKATTAGSSDVNLRFNSDTGSNYSRTYLAGNGTSALSTRASGASTGQINNYSNVSTGGLDYNAIVHIQNYSNTVTNKVVLSRTNNANNAVEASITLWRSNNAITSMEWYSSASRSFDTGSTFTLYGIKCE